MSHFIHTCICGNIIAQCRCMGPKTKLLRVSCSCAVPGKMGRDGKGEECQDKPARTPETP